MMWDVKLWPLLTGHELIWSASSFPVRPTKTHLSVQMARYTGHCHCKTVTYEINFKNDETFPRPPSLDFCGDCRRVAGSLFVVLLNSSSLIRRQAGFSYTSHKWHGLLERTNWRCTSRPKTWKGCFAQYAAVNSRFWTWGGRRSKGREE